MIYDKTDEWDMREREDEATAKAIAIKRALVLGSPKVVETGAWGEYPSPAVDPLRPARGTVYLAGPITGLEYDGARFGWRKEAARMFAPGIRILSPMRHEGHLAETLGPITDKTAEAAGHIMSKGRTIFTKDKLDIKRSDVVMVNLAGATSPARGSLIEIGMARAWEKFIVLVVDKDSFHDYAFITEAADVVVYNVKDAVEIINSLLSEGI